MIFTTVVDAILARARMPLEVVAALSPNDRLEVTPPAGSPLLVQLIADGQIIALASVEVIDGQLIATIVENHLSNGPGLAGRRIDQWKLNKATTTA